MIIDGKLVANLFRDKLKKEIDSLYSDYHKRPTLATILVGNKSESKTYVNMKEKACKSVGIDVVNYTIESTTTDELIELIQKLNNDDNINSILIQHPLPNNIDETKCFNSISPIKDADGLTAINLGKLVLNEDCFIACTAKGIIDLLDFYNIDIDGKSAVIIGRSQIIGKPISALLLNRNATVTITHSHTKDIDKIIKNADIVVAALGKQKFVKKEWIKDGAVLIDAGYNKDNIGDIDPECFEKASFYTPVPGGVGPMTITELLIQTVNAFKKQNNKQSF